MDDKLPRLPTTSLSRMLQIYLTSDVSDTVSDLIPRSAQSSDVSKAGQATGSSGRPSTCPEQDQATRASSFHVVLRE